jgi:putative molybdopterin biosynthesis protein
MPPLREGAMSQEMMNTKEVAQYLGIHEKQVYALIKAKGIPSTRVTGKWIFPKHLIDEWIAASARKGLAEAREKSRRIDGAILASGSNDPVLDMVQTYMRHAYPEFYVFSANIGSTEGLKALDKGYTDVAWSHLLDPETGEYNLPFLSQYLPNVKQPVVVTLFYRDLGIVVAPGNPLGIKGFADLAREGVRFINRQQGAGTRVLFDYHLTQLRIPTAQIKGYGKEVLTHLEVGLAIISHEADVGIATIAVSKLLGLSFIPITRERFDMVLDQKTFFVKGVQAFIDCLQSRAFRTRVDKLGSYDFTSSGRIVSASS